MGFVAENYLLGTEPYIIGKPVYFVFKCCHRHQTAHSAVHTLFGGLDEISLKKKDVLAIQQFIHLNELCSKLSSQRAFDHTISPYHPANLECNSVGDIFSSYGFKDQVRSSWATNTVVCL